MNKLFVTKFILFLCFLSGACYFFVTGWIANNAPSENGQAAFAASTRKPRTALKNIETAQVGEMVLATNPETGKTEWKKIVRVFHNTSNHLRHLTLRSESTDEVQKFETTDEHPFYVVEKGWVAAADLEIGDKVPQQNSGFAIVELTYREEKPNGVPVYNFEVEDYNTYYVAAHGARAPPVLVHNCNPVKTGGRNVPKWKWDRSPVPNREAAKAYEAIRNSKTDVSAILDNMGLNEVRSRQRLEEIKEYLFGNPHFDPDPKIAEAWHRMRSGKSPPAQMKEDMLLLQHEVAELRFRRGTSRINPMSQQDAHMRANGLHPDHNNRGYNWQDKVHND